ncbi:CsgG/HfaB family protein [Shinella sp. NM-101]|uniref:CsgG/HfaB family protein n=1 Tax=Shinella sp. NM-101 TaxID=2744455 RepID=UPI001F468E55|nr:CsgG/HfaB family protein [Shinella sp. NM-101]
MMSRRLALRAATALLLTTSLTACASMHVERMADGEAPQAIGPAARDNRTPMDPVFACYRDGLTGKGRGPVIGVGDVKDYTGKFSNVEGNAITQGGALMVYSALGKLGGRVRLAERFDPTIAERELVYTDKRQLGDGESHKLPGKNADPVKWVPYFGGSIIGSDYFIVGGITELNYNIHSGGAEIGVNNVGPKLRTFTQSVAVDLRIVDTRSLIVQKTVSLTKQYVGHDTGFGTFRFFGSDLFDINIGAKGQEPLQLGIRTTLEEATLQLVGTVLRSDPSSCLASKLPDQLRSPGTAIAEISPAPAAAQAVAYNRPRYSPP